MSAIAHDLRIPLTRLAFRLERALEGIRGRAEADIAEMQQMLGAVLSFVQATHTARPRQPQELRSLLSTIADDMTETGSRVSLEEGPDVILPADDLGLRSLFTNLIHNVHQPDPQRCHLWRRRTRTAQPAGRRGSGGDRG